MNNFAHPEKYKAIETVMRMNHVKRWHMIDTTRQQTLAEHSCNVAMLAMLCARRAPGMYFGDPMAVSALALVHDVGEVFTGDVPTPTKRMNPMLASMLGELEDQHTSFDFLYPCPGKSQWLIKVCDLADGIRFIREHGIGDIAKHATIGLEKQLEDIVIDALKNGMPQDVVDHVVGVVRFYAYAIS